MLLTSGILDLVVRTKDSAQELILAAKESEIRSLKNQIENLEAQLKYERVKSDGLVDRLLVRDAHVAAVAPAAVELSKQKDEQAAARLKVVFDQLNDIGDAVPVRDPRAFDLAGGTAVSR